MTLFASRPQAAIADAFSIQYRVKLTDPHAHVFEVTLTIERPDPAGQTLALPKWIPGSYLIRDFAKHLNRLSARTHDARPLAITPLDAAHWQIEPTEGPVEVRYQVYAWDLSVRGAHFDATHAFFNGTSVFLAVEGQRDQPVEVVLEPGEQAFQSDWQVATTLPALVTNAQGFGRFQARNYWDLIEYPVEIGTFQCLEFEACGLAHQAVFTGKIEWDRVDTEQLKADLIRICETELKLFGTPWPIERYLFQVMVTASDYGGLEHLDSTALMISRDDLPYLGRKTVYPDAYLNFLELCSHEYFHTWNVKRIQPQVYQRPSLTEPVYTRQLWWFEGITSFYDLNILWRAGILSAEQYLTRLSKEMTKVYRLPGRFQQSVAESSVLTWTKFYQQDENAPNAIVNYYTKGALIALGLDLTLRRDTQGKVSLDDVLLALWRDYGRTGVGLGEGEIEQVCERVSGLDLSDFFARYLDGTEDLPFEALFASVGIEFRLRAPSHLKDMGGHLGDEDDLEAPFEAPLVLGANFVQTEHHTLKVRHIWQEQAAVNAGLAPNDELIALNGFKIDSLSRLETYLSRHQPGDTLSCHYFRRDELHTTDLTLMPPPQDRVSLRYHDSNDQPSEEWTQWPMRSRN
ncbi:MAG: PDZ domain-containing protein [Hydrogenovibrio sp.]|uniref:M61 family metallopeptidase n=1 Tax=Hydrogenovibrio sp. TaxID=2065821 RepID=UPI00286FE104|nr:PDZ domain-containing protein [Hydrogenovibrio sp.]MDR9497714.1 PDZ domain-containing protein [Hydrogenovibrio sp.]